MRDTPIVFIVDDDAGIRESLSLLVRSAGFRPMAFPGGREFLQAAKPAGPACVLLDLRMPGMSGTEVQEHMQADACPIPVIFLSGEGDVRTAVRAVKRGAIDFLQKPDFEVSELLALVRDALEQHKAHASRREQETTLRRGLAQLSERELEVARLAAAGLANKVIGAELGISERTVEVHRGRAMRKLGLRSAPELIRLADIIDSYDR